MKTLTEIYNKYLTTDRIKRDPILELFENDEKEGEGCYITPFLSAFLNDSLVNKKGCKKLWRPGIQIIPVDRSELIIDDCYSYISPVFSVDELFHSGQSCSLEMLIFSELLEEEIKEKSIQEYPGHGTLEFTRTYKRCSDPYYEVIYNTSEYLKYEQDYLNYIRTQKLYVYYLPGWKSFKTKPVVREVYLSPESREFIDASTKKRSFVDFTKYSMAFSEEMLKEQFEIYKKLGLMVASKNMAGVEERIKTEEEKLRKLKEHHDELLDKFCYEEERLDELFKL